MKEETTAVQTELMAFPIRQLTRPSLVKRITIGVVCGLFVLLYMQHGQQSLLPSFKHQPTVINDTANWETIRFDGYSNSIVPDKADCKQVTIPQQELQVSKSRYLEDDIIDIAMEIVHPMIDYSGESKELSFRQQVAKIWAQMAGSSVWLEKHQVFFAVTRVYTYGQGVKHWSKISFLYAQIYSKDWKALDQFNITFNGANITFPRILDIPSPYKVGGGFFGPEDPRLILETSIADPEPVIIFNMIESLETSARSMHIHRPFSNYTTVLKIEHHTNTGSEKNWMPFFVPQEKVATEQPFPSKHIFFVYEFHPLKILRCHVMNGRCDWSYRQDQETAKWEEYRKDREYGDTQGVMRGGTNFVPLSISPGPGLASFVGFPRTHTDGGCFDEAIYRPVLTVLTSNGTHHWLDYVSAALDFGHSVLTDSEYNDVCDKGRILLANSISYFNETTDTMVVSFTVADSTIQVAEIRGVRKLVEELPHFKLPAPERLQSEAIQWHLNVTHDVLVCGIQSATEYALEFTNVTDRSKPRPKVGEGPEPATLPADDLPELQGEFDDED